MKQEIKLDTRPSRTDWTSREIAQLLGGIFGGLIHVSDVETIRTAVEWWASNPEAWQQLKAVEVLFKCQNGLG